MADINQVITLGIGTPSDIEHFILFGLNGSTASGIAFDFTRPLPVFEDAKRMTFESAKKIEIENDKTVRFP
jgi:hypothetical protein